jgi:phosphopantothenoylcysteine decarboxylase/phosphopantothenate--cysteine ligase
MRVSRRRVLLGVTGSIAAYKAAELARLLTRRGFCVSAVLTEAAKKFVAPLTFEALTGNPVYSEMFASGEMLHIRLERENDLILVAPATADFIAKIAVGLGDDLLSTIILSRTHPLLVAPAMNAEMYRNPLVQKNIKLLESSGAIVLPTAEGGLACGETGPGRMLEPEQIVEAVVRALSDKDLEGRQVLVTAGPTWEPLDDVRFFTNPSTGRMGKAIAEAATRRGARVVFITGPSCLPPPEGVRTVRVMTARDLLEATLKEAPQAELIYMAAAVSDYSPSRRLRGKPAKENLGDTLIVQLTKNPDILVMLSGRKKRGQVIVGFAAEWGKPDFARIHRKLSQKGVSALFVNDVSRREAGFGAETNEGWWLEPKAEPRFIPLMTKEDLADTLLDLGRALWSQAEPKTPGLRAKKQKNGLNQ